jgi:HEAT repeat protein
MSAMLQNLSFGQFSFWLGLLAGVLGFWLYTKLAPSFPGFWRRLQSGSEKARTSLTPNSTVRQREATLRHVQSLHLASALFSLDEIIVEPRLLAVPDLEDPDKEDEQLIFNDSTIPYMPDWPELAARYSTRTITLSTALSAGANLVLIGNPGSGKTVSLAHLACQLVRRAETVGNLSKLLPIYLHIADALPDGKFTEAPLGHIVNAVHPYSEYLPINRLEKLIGSSLQNNQALLLIDGLDEVSQSAHNEATAFIKGIYAAYPGIRMVVSASTENISGLTELGLVPVAMAVWNQEQYVKFVRKWSSSWWRFIRPSRQSEGDLIDPRLLNAWLLADNPVISPFDATMKAWSVFAGDATGPGYVDAIEACIHRMTAHLQNSRPALEDLAFQLVASLEIARNLKRGRGRQGDLDNTTISEQAEQTSASKKHSMKAIKTLSTVLPELLDNGLLVERTKGRISFSHPKVMAYLASCSLSEAPVSHFLSSQSDWTGKTMTLLFQAVSKDISPEIKDILSQFDDPLLRGPLMVGRWLYYSPENVSWRTNVLRFLADEIQQKYQPAGLRARILTAILMSGDPGVSVLLNQISHTSIDDLQRMTALGLGYLGDSQACNRLGEMLHNHSPLTTKAASLALVQIGTKQAYEILGTALLNESEKVRRSVAEALVKDNQDGHEILKEASQMEDLLVRRSAVFGLAQVDSPWADEILEKLSLEDEEWVVRASATQAIEQKATRDANIPHPTRQLQEIPWLIKFASDRGMGIAPGKPAENLLLTALSEGSTTQQLAALNYLSKNPQQDALPILFNLLDTGSNEVQNAVFDTLWFYAASGMDTRSPTRVH